VAEPFGPFVPQDYYRYYPDDETGSKSR